MNVEIGEYLRLDNGHIYKWESNDYEWIYEEDEQLVYGNGANEYEWECDIKKHSFNIIDLIEVGDYVNGSYVEGFIEKNKFQNKLIITEGGMIDNNDIKSIVTREMFESMEYKVKE